MHGPCHHAHKDHCVCLKVDRLPRVASTQGEGASKVDAGVGEGRGWGRADGRQQAHAMCQGSSIGPLTHYTGSANLLEERS